MPEVIDLAIVGGDGFTQARGRFPVEGGRQDGAENARLRAVIRQSDAQPYRSEPIPLGERNARSMSPRSRSRRRS